MTANPITHYCPSCDKKVILTVTPQGPHLRGSCSECGRWLTWVPHEIDPGDEKMYFGKHRGKTYSEIPIDYLRWVLDNCEHNLSSRQKNNLIAYLQRASGTTEAGHGNR